MAKTQEFLSTLDSHDNEIIKHQTFREGIQASRVAATRFGVTRRFLDTKVGPILLVQNF